MSSEQHFGPLIASRKKAASQRLWSTARPSVDFVCNAENKRALPLVIEWRIATLEDSGYGGNPVTEESDQEPAIVDIRRGTAFHRAGDTVPLNFPARCSNSNSCMENSVKTFQGQLKVLKHYFTGRVKRHMPDDCALSLWLAPWVTESSNNISIAGDEKNARRTIHEAYVQAHSL